MKRLIVILLSLTLLCACVPTPEVEPIAQHAEAPKTEGITAEQFEVPTHIELPAKGSGICSVAFDAAVDVPNGALFGISEARQHSFSDEELTALMRVFLNDDMPVPAFSARSADVSYVDDGQGGSFGVSREQFIWFRDKTRYIMQLSGMDASEKRKAQTPEIAREDAEREVAALLKRMGLERFGIADAFTEPCAFMILDMPDGWGWRFICVPVIGNVPCVYADGISFSRNTPPSIGAPWEYERIEIAVREGGVAQFAWQFPAEYGEPAADGNMAPFETIVNNAQKQLLYMKAAYDFDTDLDTDKVVTVITVDSVRLIRGTVQIKDRFDVGQNIPLWEIGYTEQYMKQDPVHLSICINAYDGTYVEPRMTYKCIMETFGNQ